MSSLRADQAIISNWIEPESKVLDLGCGDGTLLRHLADSRQATGYGLEIDTNNIAKCVAAGINVIHTDLDAGLSDFGANSFDYVLMTQTLQVVHHPDRLLDEMLRVGKQGIVTFPNFGHWYCRLTLALRGRLPISKALPNEWYDTPNIHVITLKEFERLCENKGIEILERSVVNSSHQSNFLRTLLPNLLGELALYRFQRK